MKYNCMTIDHESLCQVQNSFVTWQRSSQSKCCIFIALIFHPTWNAVWRHDNEHLLQHIYMCYFFKPVDAATALSSSLVVKCPEGQDKLWRIHWPAAAPKSILSVRCPGEGDVSGLGLAHRNCLAGGIWGPADVTACESAAVRKVRFKVYIYLKHVISHSSYLTVCPFRF